MTACRLSVMATGLFPNRHQWGVAGYRVEGHFCPCYAIDEPSLTATVLELTACSLTPIFILQHRGCSQEFQYLMCPGTTVL